MKTIILAPFAVLSLRASVVPAAMARDFHNGSTLAGDPAATQEQQQNIGVGGN